MELLVGYSTLVISILSFYLIRKEYLIKQDLILVKNQLMKIFRLKNNSQQITYFEFEPINEKNQYIHQSTILTKSLRHLNFMSQLQDYLEETDTSNFKIEYLKELEKSKIETQVSVIKSAQLLSASLKTAA